MKGLILKDLYNIIHNAKSMFFILLFFAVAFLPSSGVQGYILTCTILCTMMIIATFSFDDVSNWTPYALIMPLSRENLVAGKFIALFIFSAAGTLFGVLAGSIGIRIRNLRPRFPSGLAPSLPWLFPLYSVEYPSLLCFGSGRKKEGFLYWFPSPSLPSSAI